VTRKGWLLLVLAEAGPAGLDPVQLQKSLFLLGQKRKKEVGSGFYRFTPHNYGPFSREIYADVDELVAEAKTAKVDAPGCTWSLFSATTVGTTEAKTIRPQAPKAGAEYIKDVVPWVKRLSFQELVRSIYTNYPKYRVNSVFRG
jgi:uncharacterized protein YwgA